MAEIVIKKMTEFPNNIPINKPVPGKTGFKDRMLLKKPDTECNRSDRNKSSDDRIQHVRKKRDLIINQL